MVEARADVFEEKEPLESFPSNRVNRTNGISRDNLPRLSITRSKISKRSIKIRWIDIHRLLDMIALHKNS
jgi:hypothetical protein